jgi:hypothetical protein
MSYSISKAKLIADQLDRLASQHLHQLAGQHSNLDFWMHEAEQAIAVLDHYGDRFRKLRDAQVSWIRAHDTRVSVYCEICGGGCEFGPSTPDGPHRTPTEDLGKARESVRRAVTRYLLRLFRSGMLSESDLLGFSRRLDLPIEHEDYSSPPRDPDPH